MRRVVITGMGTVNALGQDAGTTMAALAAGRPAIAPLEIRDAARLSIRIGAGVRDWNADARFSPAELSLYDRATQFALTAGAEAMAGAGLGRAATPDIRAGVVLGTAGGGLQSAEESYRTVFEAGRDRVHPFTVPRLMHNAATSALSIRWGLGGPSFTVATACASSNHAIGLAFQMVRAGAADLMLAGGADAMLSFAGIKAWEGLRVLSPDGCRPFCATRNGMVMGEGAAVFVLEARDRALARGAGILAEIAGFGMTSDAADMVLPNPEGAAAAMRAALDDAGLSPRDIGHINAHGTGTAANDRSEASAIHAVFGEGPPVTATKSLHGHCIGAAGAVELVACILALRDGVIAPVAGHVAADPDIGLDLVTGHARKAGVGALLSNAFAFGGLNAVLALRQG
ncbi:MAG: beta-ketoacyl-[acyl-carrier-protein] synthase family protein [Rhodobacteraceae bacterium]|nr:beta-ketoacyl-[acyl-carrier-protein] synthase family protein [Paracoccaceae bacterium]